MTTKGSPVSSNHSLYNNSALSDVTIDFKDQHVFAHKAILAHKSVYFMKAFTGGFPIALRKEVNLGNDDDAEAVHAMIRHIYDLPYARKIANASKHGEHLLFLMHVFIVADKYDIASLRQKVVPDFTKHLSVAWKTPQVIECVKKLCGPEAMHLADLTLQAAITDFFADDLSKFRYHDSLVKMVNEDKSFHGRVLAGVLKSASVQSRTAIRISQPKRKRHVQDSSSDEQSP